MSNRERGLEAEILQMLEEAPEGDRLQVLRGHGYDAKRDGASWHLIAMVAGQPSLPGHYVVHRRDVVVEDQRLMALLDTLPESAVADAWQPPAFVGVWEGPETDFSARAKETVRGTEATQTPPRERGPAGGRDGLRPADRADARLG